MLENLLKLQDIKILEKKEQLFIVKGGGAAHCTHDQSITQCYAFE